MQVKSSCYILYIYRVCAVACIALARYLLVSPLDVLSTERSRL